MMWPCFSLLFTLALQTSSAADCQHAACMVEDTTMVSMMVPAKGNLAMLQKARWWGAMLQNASESIRDTVLLVGKPEKAEEQPVKALEKLMDDADKQLTGKAHSAATEPLEPEHAKDESTDTEDVEETPGKEEMKLAMQNGKVADLKEQLANEMAKVEDAMQNGKVEEMPIVTNDAKKQLAVKVEDGKDQPSKTDKAAEPSKIENASDDAKAEAADTENSETEEADTENTDSENTESNDAEAGDEQEEAEIAAANAQEVENDDTKAANENAEIQEADTENAGTEGTKSKGDKQEEAEIAAANANEAADTEKAEIEEADTKKAGTESKGDEQEEAEIAAANAQEEENEGSKEHLAANEEVKEESNGSLASENAESEKNNDAAANAQEQENEDHLAANEEALKIDQGSNATLAIEDAKSEKNNDSLAAANAQEVENDDAKENLAANEEAPKIDEVKEESNETLASKDAESEKNNDAVIGEGVEEDTSDATMQKDIDAQSNAQEEQLHKWRNSQGANGTAKKQTDEDQKDEGESTASAANEGAEMPKHEQETTEHKDEENGNEDASKALTEEHGQETKEQNDPENGSEGPAEEVTEEQDHRNDTKHPTNREIGDEGAANEVTEDQDQGNETKQQNNAEHGIEGTANETKEQKDAEIGNDGSANDVTEDQEPAEKIRIITDVPASQKVANQSTKTLGPGNTLTLDNAGFEALAKLEDADQASLYIERTLTKQGLVVSDKAGLLKYAGLCIEGKGPSSFDLLSKHIFKVATQAHGWAGILRRDSPEASNPAFKAVVKPRIGAGLTSPLNQEGYLAVMKLKSSPEMSVFIHRVVNHLNLDVKDRWGLMGIVPWYDGEKMEQSYAGLTTEILSTAVQPDKWVSMSVSSETP